MSAREYPVAHCTTFVRHGDLAGYLCQLTKDSSSLSKQLISGRNSAIIRHFCCAAT
jgi:hypothetical protein